MDEQVKIRGFRIELGEIEAVLRQYHPDDERRLVDAVVIVREDTPGEKRLVSYLALEPHNDDPVSINDIRNYLRRTLPEYMIPSAFITLPDLPVTPAGKIDRKALVARSVDEITRPNLAVAYISPRNDIEAKLVDIVSALLMLDKVGVMDNFFEIGGHSLLATQFIARVREAFNVELPLREIFEHPTIAELASSIEIHQRISETSVQIPAIKRVDRSAYRAKRSELDQSE
jgi:acyl carrier protein